MSFLKITDPKKREQMVKEFHAMKKRIQQDNLSERIGDINIQRDMSKLLKPVIESQKGIVNELKPLREEIKNLPAVTYPTLPALTAPDEGETDENLGVKDLFLGPIAARWLSEGLSNKRTDRVYGIRKTGPNEYSIGNLPVSIENNDLIINGQEYKGTPGLWELIMSPNPVNYDLEDHHNYAKILVETSAMKKGYKPESPQPISSRSRKWKEIVKPIWEGRQFYNGSNVHIESTVVIPSDPDALVERLNLLMASMQAGNTGVRNEVVSICDELKRQRVIDSNQYKTIMLQV